MDKHALKIGVVGLGKIALDQHLPAIRGNPRLQLVAGCSPEGGPDDMPVYPDMDTMLARHPDIAAVALCTPPQVRYTLACAAIDAGKHVLLEKPPAVTVEQAQDLLARAQARGVVAFAAWHSRFAPAVAPAAQWLAGRTPVAVRIEWKENVRQWHPGQKWIFEAGGMGVFDPGINALSIATRLLGPLALRNATLNIPSNCAAPVQARLQLADAQGVPVSADFDFLQQGQQTWSIFVDTSDGQHMALHLGGRILQVDGQQLFEQPDREYPELYAYFADLVASGRSDLDVAPLQVVLDAERTGQRITVEPYHE